MAFVAVRLGRRAYTAYSRKNGHTKYPIASNAGAFEGDDFSKDITVLHGVPQEATVNSRSSSIGSNTSSSKADCKDSSKTSFSSTPSDTKSPFITEAEELATTEEKFSGAATTASRPIAILPQWIASELTRLTMTEASLPHRGQSFTVTDTFSGQEILRVQRERPSLSERQFILDVRTNKEIMCVRQDVGKLPRSYRFDDPSEAQVLDLQGNYYNPAKGPKATALFTNAIDGAAVTVTMQSGLQKTSAVIKNVDTDEVLATMKSTLRDIKAIAGRRTYELEISAGVDVVFIVGMIAALDARR